MRKILLVSLMLCAHPAFAVPVLWTLQDVYFDDGATLTGSFVFDVDAPTAVVFDPWLPFGGLRDSGFTVQPYPTWIQPFYSDINIVASAPDGPVIPEENFFWHYLSGIYEAAYRGPTLATYGSYEDFLDSYDNPPVANADPAPYQSSLTFQKSDPFLACAFPQVGLGVTYACGRTLELDYGALLTNAGGIVALSGSERAFECNSFVGGCVGNDRTIVSGYLVGTTVVPIPAAVWLFASALAGLGWLGRRRTV